MESVLESVIQYLISLSSGKSITNFNWYYRQGNPNNRTTRDFLEFMLAGATSKTFASSLCYPHGKNKGNFTIIHISIAMMTCLLWELSLIFSLLRYKDQ